MRYSNVIKENKILPLKDRYTKRDFDSLIVDSLFTSGPTLTPKEARFVLICSACYHNTSVSRYIANLKTT